MAGYLFIDIESTGLSNEAAVIEMACIPVVNGEKKEPFISMIRPHRGAEISQRAFEVTKIDQTLIWDFPEPKKVLDSFFKWIDTHETVFHLAGHNVSFDRRMFRNLINRHGYYGDMVSRFGVNDVCTLSLCRKMFKGKRNKPEDFKLETVCNYFGISLVGAHRARADIEATVDLFIKLQHLIDNDEVDDNLTFLEKRRKYLDSSYVQYWEDGGIYIPASTRKNIKALNFILSQIYETDCDPIQNTLLTL